MASLDHTFQHESYWQRAFKHLVNEPLISGLLILNGVLFCSMFVGFLADKRSLTSMGPDVVIMIVTAVVVAWTVSKVVDSRG